MEAAAPKASKLNPLNGLKRCWLALFGRIGQIHFEIFFGGGVLAYMVYDFADELVVLSAMNFEPAMEAAGHMVGLTSVLVTVTLIFIAMIDVPFQNFEFTKRMRMTKQEVKDEFKDVEGRPEVKAQIRRKQREMAELRMMDAVKEADVVITNPEHFAVALVYDPESDGAPVVVAKGLDHVALRIRNEAKEHGVVQVEIPPLARALYFTTDLDQAIPEDLYYAVAQVIAYVFSLASLRRDGRTGQVPNPRFRNNIASILMVI